MANTKLTWICPSRNNCPYEHEIAAMPCIHDIKHERKLEGFCRSIGLCPNCVKIDSWSEIKSQALRHDAIGINLKVDTEKALSEETKND